MATTTRTTTKFIHKKKLFHDNEKNSRGAGEGKSGSRNKKDEEHKTSERERGGESFVFLKIFFFFYIVSHTDSCGTHMNIFKTREDNGELFFFLYTRRFLLMCHSMLCICLCVYSGSRKKKLPKIFLFFV